MEIRFYHTNEQCGCFSNFSEHGFELDGQYWPTSEHYFQAQKFTDKKYQEEIRNAKTPMKAAKIGRNRNNPLRTDWETVKYDVMKRTVLKKFMTHRDLSELLLSTADDIIIEETKDDYYWGCGENGTGENALGKILMEVRAILRQTQQLQ
jgi:ribA/ribD-fused uncharacterized protein